MLLPSPTMPGTRPPIPPSPSQPILSASAPPKPTAGETFEEAIPPSSLPMPMPPSPASPANGRPRPIVFQADPGKITFFAAKIAMQYDDLSKLPYSGQGITYSRTGYILRADFSTKARDTYAHCAPATVQSQRMEISQALQIDPSRISITCFGLKQGPASNPSSSNSMRSDGQSEAQQSSKERQLLQAEGTCSATAHFSATFSLPPRDPDLFVQTLDGWMRKNTASDECARRSRSFQIDTLVAVEVAGDFGCQDFVEQSEAQQILEASSIMCGDFFGAGEAILMNDDDRSLTSSPQLTGGNLAGVTTERVQESDWMDTGRPFLWVWVLIAAVGLLLWCCLPCFVFLLVRLRLSPSKAQLVSTGTNTTPRGSKYNNEVFCTNDEDVKGLDTIKDPLWASGPSYSAQSSCVEPRPAQSSFAVPGIAQSSFSSFSLPIGAQGSFLGAQGSFYIPRGEAYPGSAEPMQQSKSHWLRTPDSPYEIAHFQPSSCARSYPVTEVSEQDEHNGNISERSSPGVSPHTVVQFADDSYIELPMLEEGMEDFPVLDTKPSQAGRASASIVRSSSLAKISELLYSHHQQELLHSHQQEPAAEEAVAENGKAPALRCSAMDFDGPSSKQPGPGLPSVKQPFFLRAAQSFRTTLGSQTSHSTEMEGGSFARKVLRSLSSSATQRPAAHVLQAGSSKSSQVQPDPASTTPSDGAPSRTSNTSSCSRNSAADSCSKNQIAHRLCTSSSESCQVQPASNTPSNRAPSRTSNTSSCSRNSAADSCSKIQTAHRLRTGSRYSQVQPFPASTPPSKGAPSCTSNTSPYPRTGAADSCTSTDTSFSSYNSPNPAAMPHCAQASMARGMDALLAPSPAPAGRQGFHIAGGIRCAASCTVSTPAGSPHPGQTFFSIDHRSISASKGDLDAGARGHPAGEGGNLAAGAQPRARECWTSTLQSTVLLASEGKLEDKSPDIPPRPEPLPAGLEMSAELLQSVRMVAPASATGQCPPEIFPGTPQTEPEGLARDL